MKTAYNIAGFIAVVILLLLAASCRVTKYIDREKIVVDSSAVSQNETLKRTLKETIEAHEREREQWESTGVVFETEPCPDSTRTVTKIVFDNGKLKSIEGNVRALNQSLYQKENEVSALQSRLDSMAIELDRKQVELSKKVTTVTKEVVRKPGWIWWLLVIGAIGGWTGRGYFPRIKKILFT